MSEFDKNCFLRLLREAPEGVSLDIRAEHSEYLQKNVFDRLKTEGTFALDKLDWDAFQLCHVIPEDREELLARVKKDWVSGLHGFLRHFAAAPLTDRAFF